MQVLRRRSPTRRSPGGRAAAALVGAAALLLGMAAPTQAQLRLPTAPLPTLPQGPLPPLHEGLPQAVPLQELRLSTVRDLLRRHADVVEADPAGQPMRRGELLWLSPSPSALEAALAQGFEVLRDAHLPELDIRRLVLRPPAGMSTAQAAERLRRIDANAAVDFNHLYLRSGETASASAPAPSPAPAQAPTPLPAADAPRRVGLVDSGIDRRHAALSRARVTGWGCGGAEHPSRHGTAVASLLVGRDKVFAGVQPGSTLYAADVYCDRPAGGSAEEVVGALAWLARERVPVINVSLVGPANRLLELATQALLRRGHLIVAAVGNDGPAAPPLYPAAYRGVVGVTGVTPARRALPEAAQGPQVTLAAPGADLAAAWPGGGYVVARGTSFAAPLVAGLLARDLPQPDPDAAVAVLARLAREAVDLGEPGRDPVYGFGLVGEAARTPPERVQARQR